MEYIDVLTKLGITEETVQLIINRKEDQISQPPGDYKVKISSSNIHGVGLIATETISIDENIGPTDINCFRTPFNRFINHSHNPNAKIVKNNNDRYLIATREICSGEEVTVDYIDCAAQ
jgi:hypothetical protein